MHMSARSHTHTDAHKRTHEPGSLSPVRGLTKVVLRSLIAPALLSPKRSGSLATRLLHPAYDACDRPTQVKGMVRVSVDQDMV